MRSAKTLEQIARYIPAQPVLDGEDALRAGCPQCPLPLTHEQEAGRQLRGALAHRLHRGGHPTHSRDRALLRLVFQQGSGRSPQDGREEDRVIGRILRHLGLLPDPSRGPPLQEPVYEPIYNDLPAVENEDIVYQPF